MKRHNMQPQQINNDIETTLKNQFSVLYEKFQEKYGSHACDKPGCASCLVIDGNMKTHRKVCKSNGCHEDPKFKAQFCQDHLKGEHRSIVDGVQELKAGEYHIEKIIKKG